MLWLTFLLVWELAGNVIYWAVLPVHVVPNGSSLYNGFIFCDCERQRKWVEKKPKMMFFIWTDSTWATCTFFCSLLTQDMCRGSAVKSNLFTWSVYEYCMNFGFALAIQCAHGDAIYIPWARSTAIKLSDRTTASGKHLICGWCSDHFKPTASGEVKLKTNNASILSDLN